jgi:hypothetical protein
MLSRHPAECGDQAGSRNRRCLGNGQQSSQPLCIPILDCPNTGGESFAHTGVRKRGLAESPALLAGDRETVQMRGQTVVKATEVAELNVRRNGESRSLGAQRGRLFGVLLDNDSDRGTRRIQGSAAELACLRVARPSLPFLEFS